jgi:hypothetical protein
MILYKCKNKQLLISDKLYFFYKFGSQLFVIIAIKKTDLLLIKDNRNQLVR